MWRNAKVIFSEARAELQKAWYGVTSYRIALLRDDPDCAREEFDTLLDAGVTPAVRPR
jgi:phosphoribosylformylglycinamidine synthase